jgi:hypothetical protein
MSESKPDQRAAPVSAEQLRMSILQKEMEKMELEQKAKAADQKRLADFAADFPHPSRDRRRDRHGAAARHECGQGRKDGGAGLQLPVDPCTDSGRTINSNDPRWPRR